MEVIKERITTNLSRDTVLRVLADVVIINLALLAAFTLRLYMLIVVESVPVATSMLVRNYAEAYLRNFWLLTLICLVSFYFHGFYTYGRMYQGRFKALLVIEATSLSYIVYSVISLIAISILQKETFPMPRGVVVLGWGFSLVMLLIARLWVAQWSTILEDQRFSGLPKKDVTRNVLVIGGAGYIGSALIRKLLDKGYNVRILDLLVYGLEPIEDVLEHPHLEVMQADFRHVDNVVAAVRDMDAVVHLGAIVGDPACAVNEALTIESNLTATRMISEVVKGHGIERFVFASTCSVYGTGAEILDESSQLNPVSLYASTKLAAEWILKGLSEAEFAPTILRFGTIYGFSGRTRFDLVINLLVAKAFFEGKITVFGGDQWRPFVHVQDAATAITKVLAAPLDKVAGQVYNVGSNDQNYTIQQAAELINSQIPSAQVVNMGGDTDLRNYRVNFDKIQTDLDFTPEWSVQGGVQQVLDALEEGRVLDYTEAKYSNVKFLKEEQTSRLVPLGVNHWETDLLSQTTAMHKRPPADAWRRPNQPMMDVKPVRRVVQHQLEQNLSDSHRSNMKVNPVPVNFFRKENQPE